MAIQFIIISLIWVIGATSGVELQVAHEVNYTDNPVIVSCKSYLEEETQPVHIWWDVEGETPYRLIEKNMDGEIILGHVFKGYVTFGKDCIINIWNPGENIKRLKVSAFAPSDTKNFKTAFVNLRNATKHNTSVDDGSVTQTASEDTPRDYGYIGAILGALFPFVLFGTLAGYFYWKETWKNKKELPG